MSPQRIISLVGLLLIVTILIVAASRPRKTEAPTQRNLSVINNTRGIEVISAVRNGRELYVTLRNNYDKNITGLAISVGNFRFTEDFAYSGLTEAGILPYATYERRIPIPETPEPISIEAVILDGGTGDGNSAVLKEIKDDRLAGRVQIERTLKLLDNYLKLDSKSNAAVGSLKSQILSELNAPEADSLAALKQLQPDRQWNSLSEQAKNALDNGKQNVLQEFQTVENAPNKREELIRLKEYYARVLRRL